jgi:hypothetical protein
MAILMIQDASADVLATYDTVIRQLEAAGQGHPPGRQFHVAARTGDGYLVTDVWESQAALDRFFQTLGPLLEQAGGRLDPPQIYPVHNLIAGA